MVRRAAPSRPTRLVPPGSALDPHGLADAVGGEVHQVAAEHAVVGLGAGVQAEGFADPPFAARLVDVAVHARARA